MLHSCYNIWRDLVFWLGGEADGLSMVRFKGMIVLHKEREGLGVLFRDELGQLERNKIKRVVKVCGQEWKTKSKPNFYHFDFCVYF